MKAVILMAKVWPAKVLIPENVGSFRSDGELIGCVTVASEAFALSCWSLWPLRPHDWPLNRASGERIQEFQWTALFASVVRIFFAIFVRLLILGAVVIRLLLDDPVALVVVVVVVVEEVAESSKSLRDLEE